VTAHSIPDSSSVSDRRLGNRLAEMIAPPGTAQLPLSLRRVIRIAPASLTTATLTDGTRLLACGASGSSGWPGGIREPAHLFDDPRSRDLRPLCSLASARE
jgi:hypothetical protein